MKVPTYARVVVGAGLFGATLAHEFDEHGSKTLVIERSKNPGGMCYTENIEGIQVHKYGAHIFRTDSKAVWEYVNRFDEFIPYQHNVMATSRDQVYNLPFNMNTFSKLWNVRTPEEAQHMLDLTRKHYPNPKNLEEFALNEVGETVYERFIRGYTEKQWGKKCTELPPSTMSRIPIRLTYDNNYFAGKKYQGIPAHGYTEFIRRMLSGIDVAYQCDAKHLLNKYPQLGLCVYYTGPIDEFLDYRFGPLEYRTLRFEEQILDTKNFQGCSVMNYTDADVPYTRIIEHKHFLGTPSGKTVITKEYPCEWQPGMSPMYPMLDEENQKRYKQYLDYAAENYPNYIFCGRLGSYQYTDMEDTVKNATAMAGQILKDKNSNI